MKNFILLCTVMFITTSLTAQTAYFNQNFNSSDNLADYYGTPITANKFDNIITSGNTTAEILNNKLRIVKKVPSSGNSRVGVTRNTLFEGMPETGAKFLKFSVEVKISDNNSDVSDGFVFFFVNSASANVDAPGGSSGRHSFIAIDPRSTEGNFRLRVNLSTYSQELSGTQTLVCYINNSGAPAGYTDPNGQHANIGDDMLDTWVVDENGVASLLLDEVPARDGNGVVRNFKLAANPNFTATLDIDNILMEEEPVLPLPVSLTSFTGVNVGEHINLNWHTVSEQNNSHFEVLRSVDGKTFTYIGTVQGNGTSTQQHTYSYIDKSPLSGSNYYRLVQVDFDESKNVHPEVVFVKASVNSNEFKVYVTAENQIALSVYAEDNITGNLLISDIQGRKVYSHKVNLAKGYNTVHVTEAGSLNGLYIANLDMNGEYYSAKFIK